jgi:enoyl-CoA hydratase
MDGGPAASKRIINESINWNRGEMFARQRQISEPVFASDDAKDDATAFAEKRTPAWTGR